MNIMKDKLIKIAFAAGIVSLLLGVGGKALPAGTLGCFAGILALASTKWEDGDASRPGRGVGGGRPRKNKTE